MPPLVGYQLRPEPLLSVQRAAARAFGMPLPDDLLRLEQELARDFLSESSGSDSGEIKQPD